MRAIGQRLHRQLTRGVLEDVALNLAQRLARGLPARTSVALNCDWLPGRRRNSTRWRAICKRRVAVEILLDERQSEVHARGDAGRGPDRPVAQEDRLGVHVHCGIARGELGGRCPMRGRTAAVEQTGRRQQESAGAHRGGAPAVADTWEIQSSSARSAAASMQPCPPATISVSIVAGAEARLACGVTVNPLDVCKRPAIDAEQLQLVATLAPV